MADSTVTGCGFKTFLVTPDFLCTILDLITNGNTSADICACIVTTQGLIQEYEIDGVRVSIADIQCYNDTNPTSKVSIKVPVNMCSPQGAKVLFYWQIIRNIFRCAAFQDPEDKCTVNTCNSSKNYPHVSIQPIYRNCCGG